MRNQYEKQEKVLWYAQIMIFLGVLATWFNHMDMHTFLYDQYHFISDFNHFSDTGSLLF